MEETKSQLAQSGIVSMDVAPEEFDLDIARRSVSQLDR
jgi:hypothetical protein